MHCLFPKKLQALLVSINDFHKGSIVVSMIDLFAHLPKQQMTPHLLLDQNHYLLTCSHFVEKSFHDPFALLVSLKGNSETKYDFTFAVTLRSVQILAFLQSSGADFLPTRQRNTSILFYWQCVIWWENFTENSFSTSNL